MWSGLGLAPHHLQGGILAPLCLGQSRLQKSCSYSEEAVASTLPAPQNHIGQGQAPLVSIGIMSGVSCVKPLGPFPCTQRPPSKIYWLAGML